MARIAALALVAGVSVTAAEAFSGAEYLQSDASFAAGYSWGVLEGSLGVHNPDFQEAAERQRNCLYTANLRSNTLHEAVRRHLQDDPKHLTEPAFVAVLNVVSDMCPAPK